MGNMKKYSAPAMSSVRIDDAFWSPYQELVRSVMLPYQWAALNDRVEDAEPSHCIRNLRIAAGMEQGEHEGFFFQDSDLAKWLEAVAYSLQTHPDPDLEHTADEVIALLGKAQQADGYLNSYFTTRKEERWTNLHECHEMYVAGHFIEAGVAWHEATGNKNLLDIVCKIADNIDTVFGAEPGKLRGYDGHEEIELALVRLYEATGDERYLKLSCYLLEERGREPYFFTEEWNRRGRISAWTGRACDDPAKNKEYNQTHLTVKEQRFAVGHAVRQVYLLMGMAGVAMNVGDEEMLSACRDTWEDIVNRQMYITGGIGSCSIGEEFTFGYDLPNDTAYAETCACVGLAVLGQKMLQAENNRQYADVVEKALFNLIPGSMSLDGKHYFYVNPLEVWPEACGKNPVKQHVKSVRQKWFGCACCPPNLARLIASLGKYIYTFNGGELAVHQYISSEIRAEARGAEFILRQESNYPWNGEILLSISVKAPTEYTLALRIPGWCVNATLAVNGKPLPPTADEDGYSRIKRIWNDGDTVCLSLDMPVKLMQANPLVRANAGRVAIQRGPVVYCLEETECGENLSAFSIPTHAHLDAVWDETVLNGVWTVQGEALRDEPWEEAGLYRPTDKRSRPVRIKAVPYCLWGNRSPGEMTVWIREN